MTTIANARAQALSGLGSNVRIVDLSDVLDENNILWPGAPAYKVEDVATYDDGGYHARYVSAFEHAGTHFDAPEHFDPGGAINSLPRARSCSSVSRGWAALQVSQHASLLWCPLGPLPDGVAP